MIQPNSTRRQALVGGLAAIGVAAIPGRAATPPHITERWLDVGGAELYVRDTGGDARPAAILAHPVSGSAMVWQAQEASYSAAGYRVISWSRRDHARSRTKISSGEIDQTADLLRIVNALGLRRFHALGSAAGGGVMLDFAAAHPDRVRSLVVANNVGNIADPELRRRSEALRPAPFSQLPNSVRELGPNYRAANPEGVERWEKLEHEARTAPLGGQPKGTLPWDALDGLPMPSLWITGDADLFAPPAMFDEHRRRTKRGRFVVMPGVGHSAYWEDPQTFDRYVLAFWRKA